MMVKSAKTETCGGKENTMSWKVDAFMSRIIAIKDGTKSYNSRKGGFTWERLQLTTVRLI